MLQRRALSCLAVGVSTSAAAAYPRRWCSSDSSRPTAASATPASSSSSGSSSATPSANPFASTVAKTLREKLFAQDFAAMKTATPKEAELMHKWRTGDGTPEQAPRQPALPGTADGSDVEPQMADGASDVAAKFGQTFRDSRPIDPNESVESKRRRLIYQSRYRGMVEMDLIFGHFARCKLATLDTAMLDEYDTLLKQLDSELFRWLVMGVDVPEELAKLRCFGVLRRFVQEERAELLGPN